VQKAGSTEPPLWEDLVADIASASNDWAPDMAKGWVLGGSSHVSEHKRILSGLLLLATNQLVAENAKWLFV